MRRRSRHVQCSVIEAWVLRKEKPWKADNVFWEGATIYSYGHHFPMATWHGNSVLYNDGYYSRTTACHQSQLLCTAAREGVILFNVGRTCSEPPNKFHVQQYQQRVDDALEEGSNCRERVGFYLQRARFWIDQARDFCFTYGLKNTINPRLDQQGELYTRRLLMELGGIGAAERFRREMLLPKTVPVPTLVELHGITEPLIQVMRANQIRAEFERKNNESDRIRESV